MKFWLLIFLLNSEGEFVEKREVSYENIDACKKAMKDVRKPKGMKVHTLCVSDDHYNGIKQDTGVHYD